MATQERSATDAVVEARERYVAAGVATPPLVVARAEGARDRGRRRPHLHRLRRRPRLPERRPRPAGGGRRASTSRSTATSTSASWSGCTSPTSRSAAASPSSRPCRGAEQKSLLLNSGAEAVENAVKIARAATGRPGRRRLRPRLPRPDAPRHDDDQQGRPLQARLRALRARGLPRARPVPVPRRHDRRRDRTGSRRCSSPMWIPRRSPASCSSPFRERAGSSRCRATSPLVCASSATATGSCTSTTRCRAASRRTGPVWAIEHYGVEPDLLVSGKSLGGGLPLAAVTGRSEVVDAVGPGGLGGTFGGNPLACAAAVAVLDEIVERAVPAARARARRGDPGGARRHRLPRRRRGRGARPRANARARAGRGP